LVFNDIASLVITGVEKTNGGQTITTGNDDRVTTRADHGSIGKETTGTTPGVTGGIQGTDSPADKVEFSSPSNMTLSLKRIVLAVAAGINQSKFKLKWDWRNLHFVKDNGGRLRNNYKL